MNEALILDHVRTPRGRGKASGALHGVAPVQLLSGVLCALRERHDLDTALVEDVVVGCVTATGEQGANIAKAAVMAADYDISVPAKQLSRFCASGLDAVNSVAAQIMAGQADLGIAGGVESMSRVPMGADGGAFLVDVEFRIKAGFIPQGVAADLLATVSGISRDEVDEIALASQSRARAAWEEGRFRRSIVPVLDPSGNTLLDRDELIRPSTTLADLARLEPSFAAMARSQGIEDIVRTRYPGVSHLRHVHHAGNSSGVADGAAAVLVGSQSAASTLGLKPRARVKGFVCTSAEPTIMLTGPVPAATRLLRRCGMVASDIDLYELNEAFAAVVLYFMRELGVPHEKINVAGGAIAMGHPLGASGAMILGTALDELERADKSTAMITLCAGGGIGIATIIERI